jgi:hypothetical protein
MRSPQRVLGPIVRDRIDAHDPAERSDSRVVTFHGEGALSGMIPRRLTMLSVLLAGAVCKQDEPGPS